MCLVVVGRYINLTSEYLLTGGLLYHLLHVAATTSAASFQEKEIMQHFQAGNLIEFACYINGILS